MDPYLPTNDPETLKKVRAAAQRTARLDEIDRRHGNPTPQQQGLTALLRTAITALLCGLETRRGNALYEGLVMVVQAEYLARQLEQHVDIEVKEKE